MTLKLRIVVSEAEEDVAVDVRVHRASQSYMRGWVIYCGEDAFLERPQHYDAKSASLILTQLINLNYHLTS